MQRSDTISVNDADLVTRCAAVIDVPKAAPPDSFVLHAPLELLARAILLERAPAEARPDARARMQWLADAYAEAGPSADPSPPPEGLAVDDVLPSLAAAGHAPILLSLRPRVAAVGATFGARLVAAELDRHPDWRLRWPTSRRTSGAGSGDLAERLAAPRSPGDAGSDFIYPTMHLTETSGLAAEVLGEPLRGLPLEEARRTLLRVAARSMLQDNPSAAPYGWTHCLTMPQAVLVAADNGADPELAIAVAATYVLGFRATQGGVRVVEDWQPRRKSAAGRVWWASEHELPALVSELVAFAVIHPDAHVAKYTLACLDAAFADPDGSRLYLAAAAHLQDWWKAVPFPDDPIIGGPRP